jgi:hypothetical protein
MNVSHDSQKIGENIVDLNIQNISEFHNPFS